MQPRKPVQRATTYALSSRASGKADVKLAACHLCLKRMASSEPREAGASRPRLGGRSQEIGAGVTLGALGRRTLADLTALRSDQAYSQG